MFLFFYNDLIFTARLLYSATLVKLMMQQLRFFITGLRKSIYSLQLRICVLDKCSTVLQQMKCCDATKMPILLQSVSKKNNSLIVSVNSFNYTTDCINIASP